MGEEHSPCFPSGSEHSTWSPIEESCLGSLEVVDNSWCPLVLTMPVLGFLALWGCGGRPCPNHKRKGDILSHFWQESAHVLWLKKWDWGSSSLKWNQKCLSCQKGENECHMIEKFSKYKKPQGGQRNKNKGKKKPLSKHMCGFCLMFELVLEEEWRRQSSWLVS